LRAGRCAKNGASNKQTTKQTYNQKNEQNTNKQRNTNSTAVARIAKRRAGMRFERLKKISLKQFEECFRFGIVRAAQPGLAAQMGEDCM